MQPDDTVHEVDTAEVTPLWFTKNFHNTPAIPGAGVLFCDVVLTSIAGVLGTVHDADDSPLGTIICHLMHQQLVWVLYVPHSRFYSCIRALCVMPHTQNTPSHRKM